MLSHPKQARPRYYTCVLSRNLSTVQGSSSGSSHRLVLHIIILSHPKQARPRYYTCVLSRNLSTVHGSSSGSSHRLVLHIIILSQPKQVPPVLLLYLCSLQEPLHCPWFFIRQLTQTGVTHNNTCHSLNKYHQYCYYTCVLSRNLSTVHGSSSGSSHRLVTDISCSTASIRNSTRSLARRIINSSSPSALYTLYKGRSTRYRHIRVNLFF